MAWDMIHEVRVKTKEEIKNCKECIRNIFVDKGKN
jgi:hypothetical protein